MCLLAFAWRAHGSLDLVLGANRDEYHARPTAPAGYWTHAPDVLAGRDLRSGGTWLGVTRQGRFAAVTNYRDPGDVRPTARSRGELVASFLESPIPARDYAAAVHAAAAAYNGFNLVVGDGEELWYAASREAAPREVAPGLHALSNGLLDMPWPKVEASRARLADAIRQVDPEPEVFALLADRGFAPDEALPDTGVGIALERALSAPFVALEGYGTRSSTYVAMKAPRLRFVERSWDERGRLLGEQRFEI